MTNQSATWRVSGESTDPSASQSRTRPGAATVAGALRTACDGRARSAPLHAAQRASLRSRGSPGEHEKEDLPVQKAARFAAGRARRAARPSGCDRARCDPHADRLLRRQLVPLVGRRVPRTSRAAAATGASVIHTTANWATIAPTKPANAVERRRSGLQARRPRRARLPVGPLRPARDDQHHRHAEVGERQQDAEPHADAPLRPDDVHARCSRRATTAAPGTGSVGLWSVWNEPNLQLFLTPQYVGKKIVGPANYAKLYKAAYAGIKAGNPLAKVAIGETSARGRDKPLARRQRSRSRRARSRGCSRR